MHIQSSHSHNRSKSGTETVKLQTELNYAMSHGDIIAGMIHAFRELQRKRI